MNTRAFGMWSAIAIGGITLWRIQGQKDSSSRVRRAWAGFAMVLLVSALTDLDARLGGYFGVAVVLGLLYGGKNSLAGVFSGFIGKIIGTEATSVAPPPGHVGTNPPPAGGV